jgi:hypothetical protein
VRGTYLANVGCQRETSQYEDEVIVSKANSAVSIRLGTEEAVKLLSKSTFDKIDTKTILEIGEKQVDE